VVCSRDSSSSSSADTLGCWSHALLLLLLQGRVCACAVWRPLLLLLKVVPLLLLLLLLWKWWWPLRVVLLLLGVMLGPIPLRRPCCLLLLLWLDLLQGRHAGVLHAHALLLQLLWPLPLLLSAAAAILLYML
jgi:hypothetical protein